MKNKKPVKKGWKKCPLCGGVGSIRKDHNRAELWCQKCGVVIADATKYYFSK